MTLETFFEKFDQFADAPDAVAKMRELVLRLNANGAPLRSASSQRQRRAPSQPGATPQDHRPHSFPALKGRSNPSSSDAMRGLHPGGWNAPSGLRSFSDAIPRALPWAGMGRRVAAPGMNANGAPHPSLGQRPRTIAPFHSQP